MEETTNATTADVTSEPVMNTESTNNINGDSFKKEDLLDKCYLCGRPSEKLIPVTVRSNTSDIATKVCPYCLSIRRRIPYTRQTPKIGRNEPCPCKSGKKYKRCCGK